MGRIVIQMNSRELILYLDPVNNVSEKLINDLTPKGCEVIFARPFGNLIPEIYSFDIRYIVVANSPVTSELMGSFENLKLIQKTGAGTENIDKHAASLLGIPVSTTPGANSKAVAELVILYILALYRSLIELDRETKQGNWLMWEKRHQSFELKGKEVGLIGFGNIGKALNKRLQGFEVKVSYFDVKRLGYVEEKFLGVEYKSINDILTNSDIISLHLPLNDATRNLIGKEQLDMVKPNSILINTSRGAIVDEAALLEALKSKKLAGAALDTYANEPVNPDNPLLKLSNVITTPHIGAGTIDTWKTVLMCAFENIERVTKGLAPENVINEVRA